MNKVRKPDRFSKVIKVVIILFLLKMFVWSCILQFGQLCLKLFGKSPKIFGWISEKKISLSILHKKQFSFLKRIPVEW